MTVRFVRGNLFNSGAEVLVNAVNCIGVMGGGIALEFKNRYPDMFISYKLVCNNKMLVPGTVHTFPSGDLTKQPHIINFPTKTDLSPSKLIYVMLGLPTLVSECQRLGVRSVAIPALGCGLGGLDWEDVKELIQNEMSKLKGVDVMVYEPN
jgi:O-acetyl-ADP-ribose deacetylase (regulator of RNase III)